MCDLHFFRVIHDGDRVGLVAALAAGDAGEGSEGGFGGLDCDIVVEVGDGELDHGAVTTSCGAAARALLVRAFFSGGSFLCLGERSEGKER